MNGPDDEMRWAFLDGELPPGEARAVSQALPPPERDRLARELWFEGRLAEALRCGADCPDAVWEAATRVVAARRRAQGARATRRWWVTAIPLAAAALLLVVGILSWPDGPDKPAAPPAEPEFLTMEQGGLDSLVARMQVPDDAVQVQNFLDIHASPLLLNPAIHSADYQGVRLLGAREDHYGDDPVIELAYDCGGVPAKVVIVPVAGHAAHEVGEAVALGRVGTAQVIGKLLVAVVGADLPHDLVRVLDLPGLPPWTGEVDAPPDTPAPDSPAEAADTAAPGWEGDTQPESGQPVPAVDGTV